MQLNYLRQNGLTLIELVFSLLFLGLIVLAALEGYTVLDRVDAKKLVSEMEEVKTMFHAYRSTYKAIPGDDALASEHLTGPIANGNGDNRIINNVSVGSWDDNRADPGNESGLFWNHVRLAKLAEGNPSDLRAFNALGGILGVSASRSRLPARPAEAIGLHAVCSSGIPGRTARLMDQEADDGGATHGRVWAADETSGRPVTSADAPSQYKDTLFYTVCMAF
ncbi:hypothetical protein LE190_14360 [Massilia oculi]|uniref:Prepilin-type N-terminal cleavage/methylation domain-containing protein n=1 Tax=Massilia hydrophila TaxID=3044279 RepID=A0ABS7YBP7_9BURK|nr:hypothetical protein [Massilia oculi]MCA1857101.1 hypothetical protein [Massilia oculi]